jgi:hypothetical protein
MLKYRKIGIGLFRVAGGEKSERGIGLACQKVFRYPQHNLFCLLDTAGKLPFARSLVKGLLRFDGFRAMNKTTFNSSHWNFYYC